MEQEVTGSILTKLGIDWRLLIAQILNFLVVLFVLYRYAYKPIVRALEGRSATIAKSLENAKTVEKHLQEGAAERAALLTSSREESASIVATARADAEHHRDALLEKTRGEVQEMLQQTRREAQSIKDDVVRDAQKELADLVVDATQAVVGERLTEKRDRTLIEETLHRLRS